MIRLSYMTLSSVTKVPGLCQVQLRLLIVRVTGEDRGTEVKCVAQNQGGRQEVAAQLQLEGKFIEAYVLCPRFDQVKYIKVKHNIVM